MWQIFCFNVCIVILGCDKDWPKKNLKNPGYYCLIIPRCDPSMTVSIMTLSDHENQRPRVRRIRSHLGLIHDKNKMYPISSYNKYPVLNPYLTLYWAYQLNYPIITSWVLVFFAVQTMSNRVCVEVVLVARREAVNWFLKWMKNESPDRYFSWIHVSKGSFWSLQSPALISV